MTVQSPPYALQNSAHSAALFRQASTSFVTTTGVGGVGELQVNANGGMSVNVAAGRAWILGTSVTGAAGQKFSTQGNYFALNDAPVNLTIASSDPVNPRIDVVYIAVTDSFYSGGTDGVVLGVVTGTPAASPAQPPVPTNALLLATIQVIATGNNITAANITDKRAIFGVTGESTVVSAALSVASNTDTSLSTAGAVPWLRLGSIFVPPWATTATCLMNINGYYPQATGSDYYVQTQIGNTGTQFRRLATAFAANNTRMTHGTSDYINVASMAGTQQAITIMTQCGSASAGLRADAYTTASIQVTFT